VGESVVFVVNSISSPVWWRATLAVVKLAMNELTCEQVSFSSPFRHQLLAAFGDRFADCLEHGRGGWPAQPLGGEPCGEFEDRRYFGWQNSVQHRLAIVDEGRQQADAGAGEGGNLDLHAGRSEGDPVVSGDAGEQVEIFDAEQALDVEDQRVLGESFDRFWCAVVDFAVSRGVKAELAVGAWPMPMQPLQPGVHQSTGWCTLPHWRLCWAFAMASAVVS
jgi:hypothetical protein